MDIYSHELASFKREIQSLSDEIEKGVPSGDNLTHFSLGISNRANLMLIGLCSLVEAFLYEIAVDEEKKNNFKISDLTGNGLKRLQNYIARTQRIDFGKIRGWGDFNQIYILRNALVHGYGGLVDSSDATNVEKALDILKLPEVLIAKKRIRMNTNALEKLCNIVESTIDELKVNA